MNGHRIISDTYYPLNEDDVVRIGETALSWTEDFYRLEKRSQKDRIKRKVFNFDSREDSDEDAVSNSSWMVFICGLLFFGLVAYIIINYFTSFALRIGATLGNAAIIKLFPHYLRGYYVLHGQWLPMIATVVLGGLTSLLDFLTGEKNNKLISAGKWLGSTGASIALAFIIWVLFA